MIKRVFCLLLIVCVCTAYKIPANAEAASFTDAASIKYLEAVQALVNDEVITGYPDGSFRPEGTLTRAEACAILTRLSGEKPNGAASFSDVPDNNWATGYIAYCAEKGYVSGYGNGKFGPTDKLTGSAWSKMILSAIGYDAESSGMLGSSWQLGVADLASDVLLYQDMSDFEADRPITRDSACQIAYNGLYRNGSVSDNQINAVGAISELSYAFSNTKKGFEYPAIYFIPEERYHLVFGDNERAHTLFQLTPRWVGNCFGISATSGMFFQNDNGIDLDQFLDEAKIPADLKLQDKNNQWGLTLKEFIEAVQISQSADTIQKALSKDHVNDLDTLCAEVAEFQKTGKNAVVVGLTVPGSGHALLAYALEAIDDHESHLLVYDSNTPNDSTRYISVFKNAEGKYSGWSYNIFPDKEWNSEIDHSAISFVTYADYFQIWQNRGKNNISDELLFTTNRDVIVKDSQGNRIADVKDGEVKSYRDDVYSMVNIGIRSDMEELEDGHTSIWLPVEKCTVERTDSNESNGDLEIVLSHVNQSASISTDAGAITFDIDDDTKTRTVNLKSDEAGSSYSIIVRSSFDSNNEANELTLTGTVHEDGITFGQKSGQIVIDGVDLDKDRLIVDGEEIRPSLKFSQNRYTCDVGDTIEITAEYTTAVSANVELDIDSLNEYSENVRWTVGKPELISKLKTYHFIGTFVAREPGTYEIPIKIGELQAKTSIIVNESDSVPLQEVISVEPSLSFEQDRYTCHVGDEIEVVAIYTADANVELETIPFADNTDNIRWILSDPVVSGNVKTYELTGTFVAQDAGTYELSIQVNMLVAKTWVIVDALEEPEEERMDTVHVEPTLAFEQETYHCYIGERTELAALYTAGPNVTLDANLDSENDSDQWNVQKVNSSKEETVYRISGYFCTENAGTYRISITVGELTAWTTVIVEKKDVPIEIEEVYVEPTLEFEENSYTCVEGDTIEIAAIYTGATDNIEITQGNSSSLLEWADWNIRLISESDGEKTFRLSNFVYVMEPGSYPVSLSVGDVSDSTVIIAEDRTPIEE